jgi:hypothetical protein
MQMQDPQRPLHGLFDRTRWRQLGQLLFALYLVKGLLWLTLGYYAFH